MKRFRPGGRSLRRDRRGNVSLMLAGALPLLVATTAFAVDTASFYVAKRHLQGTADAAALAAVADVSDGRRAAADVVRASGGIGDEIDRYQLGFYSADPAVPAASRFTATSDAGRADAVQVRLVRGVPTFFARAFGTRSVELSASATAARIDLAAFSLGSRVAAVQDGLPSAILSGLAGADIPLSISDYNALVSTQVDVLRVAERLRSRLPVSAASFADVFAARVTLPQVIGALADASGGAAADSLRLIAQRVPARDVPLGALIDLGPLGARTSSDHRSPVSVDAYSLLRVLLEGGEAHRLSIDLGASARGVLDARLSVAIGRRAARSPWLAVSGARRVTIRTAQTRLLLDLTLAAPVAPGVAELRAPLYVELAPASATLQAVSCRGGRAAATASLDVTPAVGQVAIAAVDRSRFDDVSTPLALTPATLVGTPLATVTGFAQLDFSYEQPQRVDFSANDIADHTPRTVTARGLAQSLATSLAQRLTVQARVLGLGLTSDAAATSTAALVMQSAPAIDQMLALASIVSGIKVGQADSWVNGVRCGTPILVL